MRQCGDCNSAASSCPSDRSARAPASGANISATTKAARSMRAWPRCRPSAGCGVCRWLAEADTADLRRPDRSHYVIDVMPDFVTLRNDETGELEHIQVVQIWVDPRFPDAHREPALRAYLERRAEERIVGLIRFDDTNGFVLFPPKLSSNGQWNEARSSVRTETHSPEQLLRAMARPNAPLA
jgi:hypothetical protein